MKKLLVNAIITPDGTWLQSNHTHDYKSHQDKNGETYSVDGGLDYVRRSVNREPAANLCLFSDDPHEALRLHFCWGTRGKNGDENISWVPLYKLATEHIEKILETQTHINSSVRKLFKDELKYRKETHE